MKKIMRSLHVTYTLRFNSKNAQIFNYMSTCFYFRVVMSPAISV